MVFGRNGSRSLLNTEVGAAYKVRGDDAIAVIILEINQLKAYPYCGNLIIERGRAEYAKNVPERTRSVAFDMCGVSSDGKYRISDSQRIKTYSNEFVLKPTKSLRSLAIKGAAFSAMTVATFSGLLIALLMSLLIFVNVSGVLSFLGVFLCTYAVIWLFVFMIVFQDRMFESPYSLSFNSDKLSGVKTKSGHDVVLSENDDVEKIYGSIVIKPAVYENGVMVESATLLPKSWDMKGLTDSDAYALVNCNNKHKHNCNEAGHVFHSSLSRFSMIKFFVGILLSKNKRI